VIVGHLPQNIAIYKNNTDFNIANWAKRDIKILAIKTHYTVFNSKPHQNMVPAGSSDAKSVQRFPEMNLPRDQIIFAVPKR